MLSCQCALSEQAGHLLSRPPHALHQKKDPYEMAGQIAENKPPLILEAPRLAPCSRATVELSMAPGLHLSGRRRNQPALGKWI